MPHQPSYERYTYKSIMLRNAGRSCARALFVVETTSGQIREEMLDFPVIEARIRLWEDAFAHNPRLLHQDKRGYQNCRQYARALAEALKARAI